MRKEGAIVDQDDARHKRPCELSDHEVFLLMQTFTQDKPMVTEADALTLCHWAQGIRFSSHVLQLVLEGHLRVVVEGQEVRVGLPVAPQKGGGGEQTQGNERQR